MSNDAHWTWENNKHTNNFIKELEITKKNQTELKNTVTERKNNQKESAVDLMIQRNGLMIWKIEQWKSCKNRKEKTIFFRKEDSLGDFWNNIRYINIHIIGSSEGKERESKGKITYLKK